MIYLKFLAISVLFFIFPLLGDSFTPIKDNTRTPILTPSFAQRQSAKIRLDNGLEAWIISDPLAAQSGAVLTVQAGSWDDPDAYPGLAHFLEHMLFLGTEKYPIESDYDRFIKAHGGQANAYTTSDYTLYLFSINHPAFEEALDRFASFFKNPLFNPSGVGRELQAIDQEFSKNVNNDEDRIFHVQKELSNPKHPYHRFSTGNSSTLSNVSQEVLKEWYKMHYSANLMRLIVYSANPLEDLKKWVIEDFSAIPSTGLAPLKVHAFIQDTSSLQGKMTYIEPIRETRSLRLAWEIPLSTVDPQREYKIESLLCYVLGHEGEGSLLAALKKEHLAENLTCGAYRLGTQTLLFAIQIELTEEGLKEATHVITRCFEAIHHLQEAPFPGYLFDEVQKIALANYQYQQPEDPFTMLMSLGGLLVNEDLASFPEKQWIPQKFDPRQVKLFLNELTPERAAIFLIAKQTEVPIQMDKKEKWMEVSYGQRALSTEELKAWHNPPKTKSLHLPASNPFIPRQPVPIHQDQKENEKQVPKPVVLIDQEPGLLYFKEDKQFLVPQILWSFEIQSPLINKDSASLAVLGDLYIKCLQEVLNPYYYPASLADLEYEVKQEESGIVLTIQGYSDKAEVLFDEIMAKIKNCRSTEEEFGLYKKQLLREYQNFSQESALDQGIETLQSIMHQTYASFAQKAQAIQTVTYRQFTAYTHLLFDQTYVRGLVYGNVNEEQAKRLWQKLQTTLDSQVLPENERFAEQILVLPDSGPYSLKINVPSPAHAAVLAIEDRLFSFKTRAAQQILSQAMSSPFYATLRTKQQTGYIVYNTAEELNKHLFTVFAVQSNTHDARDLLARFELFIETFLQEMATKELTEEKFEVIREALKTKMQQPPQNLVEMGQLLKLLAFRYDGDFEWIDKRVKGFQELTYPEFLEIAMQFLGKENKKRLAILVRGKVSPIKNLHYAPLTTTQELKKISQYTHIK